MANLPSRTSVGVPVLLALLLACWVYLLVTISLWMNKTPVAGRETDRIMQQVFSGAVALVVWILLGALLLLADAKAVLPAEVGLASWFCLPASGFLALVAISAMYDPLAKWAALIPAVLPVLIAGYVVSLLFSPGRWLTPVKAGLSMWAAVLLLGLLPVPKALSYYPQQVPAERIEAKPGPELDRFLAIERENRRQAGLEQIRGINSETTIGDLESLVRPDSPVRSEAMAAMRQLPNRQADAAKRLRYDEVWILRLLPDIDVTPTPGLCQAGRGFLARLVQQDRRAMGPEPRASMGPILEEGLPGIGWLAAHCDLAKELDLLDGLAKDQSDTPKIRQFRDALASFREKQ